MPTGDPEVAIVLQLEVTGLVALPLICPSVPSVSFLIAPPSWLEAPVPTRC